MKKSLTHIILTTVLASFTVTASAKAFVVDPYQEIKVQAEQQGEVSVIVTLGSNKPVGEMLSALQANEPQPEPQSYTAQQEDFMGRLGSTDVLFYHYFDASPSISLKLDKIALERLLKIKEVVSIVPALDGDLL